MMFIVCSFPVLKSTHLFIYTRLSWSRSRGVLELVWSLLEPIPACWARGRNTPWTGRQSTQSGSIRAHTSLTHSYLGAIWSLLLAYLHIFVLWEEPGVPRGNPHEHKENVQTPHRKGKVGTQTRDLLAVRRQHYPLHHHAAPVSKLTH
ncbi:hypothetical protein ANANG_G00229580 [Anguilla anguilla]|uniref:Uncharacterized protein n=1 Tax=Anguilla anguilla TaxID=7936 RepID=A0A9D3LZI7_ANGAN|nr:hypothetical protein ANANG_G00229580 [Anguilla anguilla]